MDFLSFSALPGYLYCLNIFCWYIMILLIYYDFWHCVYIGFICVCLCCAFSSLNYYFVYMPISLILWKEREKKTWSLVVGRCRGSGRSCMKGNVVWLIIMYKSIINYMCVHMYELFHVCEYNLVQISGPHIYRAIIGHNSKLYPWNLIKGS